MKDLLDHLGLAFLAQIDQLPLNANRSFEKYGNVSIYNRLITTRSLIDTLTEFEFNSTELTRTRAAVCALLNIFGWSLRASALAYLSKRHTSELVRALQPFLKIRASKQDSQK
jgi:hypothetical protein